MSGAAEIYARVLANTVEQIVSAVLPGAGVALVRLAVFMTLPLPGFGFATTLCPTARAGPGSLFEGG